MASRNERQRALDRAKYDRQLARRAARARRRRQWIAGAGTALAVLLIVAGTVYFFRGDDDGRPTGAGACGWSRLDPAANPRLKDVGTPPREGNPTAGTTPMSINTNVGQIGVTLEQGTAPCGIASLRHLSAKGFYAGTACHELTGDYLRCGDPSGTGEGGPTYGLLGENLPAAASGTPGPGTPAQYLRGTVALFRTGPGTYGSQFVIVHKDIRTSDPTLSPVGYVSTNMGLVDKIVRAGTVADAAGAKTKPASPVTIDTLKVDDRVILPGDGAPATGAPAPSAAGR
ncbi:peptidyl-prolyl cis-trans isomerase [Pilimelia terevasa]|uniref:Peptidyl-prolyl cis-trans isomerase n=1 Tax=Pilimelia terevasa TaxID=53372 RepID=A0A8J3BJF2_9ACTN|nr:peptidylprolyl isomerase [Pilimelia terevasa]GGK25460.1 peptidyl-prolyl cis-trans isomerase [Pilimelia terevasa]